MPGQSDLRQTQRLSPLYAALLDCFGDAAVRDLLWLLSSPGLLNPGAANIPQAMHEITPEQESRIVDWLYATEAQPAPLHAWLAASPQKRLGHYAEQLLAFFLSEGTVGRLIAANLPLRRANQTLGECDFLLETHDGRRLHWELAVKCYLYVDEPDPSAPPQVPGTGDDGAARPGAYASLACYVGPNLADRFDLKLARMIEHQLPLSARPEFRALVAGGPWQAELFLCGWLFYPLAPRRQSACRISALLNPQHMRGWWASVSDWQRWQPTLGAQAWVVLPRLEWMAQRRFEAPAPLEVNSLGGTPLGGTPLGEPLLDSAAMLARLEAHFSPAAGAIAAQAELEPNMTAPIPPFAGATASSAVNLRADSPGAPETKSNPKPAGPWLIAGLKRRGDMWVECTRGFVVDEDWFARARVYAASRQPGKASQA